MSVRLFLSAVSDEFCDYREHLRSDLTLKDVEVKTQEDFKDPGTGTLEKLDRYIADCDAVVHLVGEMTGAIAMDPSTEFIASKNPSVANKLPPLKEVLDKRLDVSYTQWEAWLALYHSKRLVIAEADRAAPRAPHFAPTDASRAAQQVHLRRLSVMERFPSCTFTSSDNLAKYILGGLILDLLTIDAIKSVEEKFNQGIYNNKTELRSILGDIQSNMAALNADKGSHIYEFS